MAHLAEKWLSALFALVIMLAATPLVAQDDRVGAPARQPFRYQFCNDTGRPMFIALGYASEAVGWRAKGWYEIAAGECRSFDRAMEGNAALAYVYARNVDGDWGGDGQGLNSASTFCILAQPFDLPSVDILSGATRCPAGQQTVYFRHLERGERRITFTDPRSDPVAMLPPESSTEDRAPRYPQVLKMICAPVDGQGYSITSRNAAGSQVDESRCFPLKIDDWPNYFVNVVRDQIQICAVDDEGVQRACTAWQYLRAQGNPLLSPSREGFARLGFRIGAWAGGMRPDDAATANRGEVNAPITAYIGEEFGVGLYNSMVQEGRGRAQLILMPIATAWTNSPSHQNVLRGNVGGLARQAAGIARSELRAWDLHRVQRINEIVRPYEEARRAARDAANELAERRDNARERLERPLEQPGRTIECVVTLFHSCH